MARKRKNPAAKYAFIGLILVSTACISTALTGAAKGMIAANFFPVQNTESLDLVFNISWPLIIVGLAAYALLAPDVVRRFLTGRQARYGSNSLILTLAFIGVVVVLNTLAHQNPTLLGAPWDLTDDRSNTLAPETLQALETLPQKVKATAFFSFNLNRTDAEELLRNFQVNSKGKFEYEFVDPDLDPVLAREAGVTGDGKILLEMGEQREIASSASETELARSMIRLISPQERVLYFLEGHGEAVIESSGREQVGYTVAKRTLESKNYTVNTLNLLTANQVPEDALVIIIAGPQKPLSDAEVRLLKDYVGRGGALLVMQNPSLLTEFGDLADPLAAYLERDWGITLQNDVIFDFSSQQPLNAISAYANQHPITQNLSQNYSIIMPQARSIDIAEPAPEGVSLTALVSTSENSWGETDISGSTEQFKYDDGVDFLGPLNMIAAGENSSTQGRVVVFGNSLFASDENFDVLGNGNIFINSVDWAGEQEELIDITPRERTPRVLKVVPNWLFILLILFSVFILPGSIVVMGVSAWLARRRRG
jgi:ABC-type uncharacterized transport system involved in gliding motility auxiliary subunit